MLNKKGMGISEGYAIGSVFIIDQGMDELVEGTNLSVEEELDRFKEACRKSVEDLQGLYNKMLADHGEEKAQIFEAHMEIVQDPELSNQVTDKIHNNKCSAEWAVEAVGNDLIAMFEAMDNEYFKERALDMKDIKNRLIRNLQGKDQGEHELIEPSIIVAKDLTPSETSSLDKDKVLGIITEVGGKTSHSAIIARMLSIPYIVLSDIMTLDIHNKKLILDGGTGDLIIEPEDETLKRYEDLRDEFIQFRLKYKTVKGLESETLDGKSVVLRANIASVKDMEDAAETDAQGVGLFRTEFIYMNREQAPTFEEQVEIYKAVLIKAKGHPVTFRTLDIGGDKKTPIFDIAEEMNPFLGYRGIRLCLDRTEVFKTQLKAMMAASIAGSTKIMFPMIASLMELRTAKALLEDVKLELDAENIPYNPTVKVGIMIETPSSVMMADVFAKEVDFFSVGTNDLTQYMLAADRMNAGVAYLYSGFDPAILRSIHHVAKAAKAYGTEMSICGELAAEVKLVPFWIYCGIDTLSMNGPMIEKVKWYIRHMNISTGKYLLDSVLEVGTEEECRNLVEDILNQVLTI